MNADKRDGAPPPAGQTSSAGGGKETLIVFATQLWTLAVGLGTQSVLAWMLGPAGRGEYAVCMLFGGIFGVIFTFGTDRAAQYFVMSKEQSLSHAGSVAIIAASLWLCARNCYRLGVDPQPDQLLPKGRRHRVRDSACPYSIDRIDHDARSCSLLGSAGSRDSGSLRFCRPPVPWRSLWGSSRCSALASMVLFSPKL